MKLILNLHVGTKMHGYVAYRKSSDRNVQKTSNVTCLTSNFWIIYSIQIEARQFNYHFIEFTPQDKPYCASCFGELFAKRCTACTKPITGAGGTRYLNHRQLAVSIPRLSAPSWHLLGKINAREHSSQQDICDFHHGQQF